MRRATLLALAVLAACGSQEAPVRGKVAESSPSTAVVAARLPRAPGAMSPSLVAIGPSGAPGTPADHAADVSDGSQLADVDSCATCHPDAAAQWSQSAHSFASFGNPIYRVNVELARDELGRPASKHCGGCHDMPLLVDGMMASDVPAADLRAHSGVTCRLCHGIQAVTKDGNGSYVWSPAPGGGPIDAPDLANAASIERHRAQASVRPLGTELCVGCHRGFLSPDMGDGMPVHLTGLDEPGAWRSSAYTGNGIARIDSVDKRTCIDCHMVREPASTAELGAKSGTFASHRFLGGHTWMAGMRGDKDELARLQAKLEGVASIDVLAAPTPARPGQLAFDVVIRNLLVGHRFPGGVLDIQDTWIEVEVKDATGRVIAASGRAHESDPSDEEAHVLRTLVVDDKGKVLEHHEMPRFRTQIATQTLAPREAQAIRYALALAPGASTDVTVTARLRHRSRTLAMQQEVCRAARTPAGNAFLHGAKGARELELDPCRPQPITKIAEATIALATDAPTWQRQYEHGMALVATISERLEEARSVLDQALAVAPTGRPQAMVLVQLAQVASKQGRADDALALVARARQALALEKMVSDTISRGFALDAMKMVSDTISGPPVLDAIEADALARVWRWRDAVAPAARTASRAPQNASAWVMAARCYASVGDDANALAAAVKGLELAPRDSDLLRSQATALAGLGRPEADAALAAYDRFRSPDDAAELRIGCAASSRRCEREREQGHVHELRAVR